MSKDSNLTAKLGFPNVEAYFSEGSNLNTNSLSVYSDSPYLFSEIYHRKPYNSLYNIDLLYYKYGFYACILSFSD